MNLNHYLDQTASERGIEIALRYSAGEVTYSSFLEAVRRLSRGLHSLGIGHGDRVAIMLPNLPQFPIVFYAILRLGAIAVPVNMMYKGREIVALLDDSEAKALIAWHGVWGNISRRVGSLTSLKHIIMLGEEIPEDTINLSRLIGSYKPMADIADMDEGDPAVIQYTAGATGSPKGVELTCGNLYSNVSACREILKITSRDTLIAALPFFHPMGQTLIMHMGLLTGGVLELVPKIDAEILHARLTDGSTTVFVGVPSMFNMAIQHAPNSDEPPENPLRLCVCGGGGLHEDTLKEFERTFGTYILESYTLTETSPVTSFNQWRTGRRVGSLGHPIPGVEMKVINEHGDETSIGEVGEIIIKGSNVMSRYINRPRLSSETLVDGWLHTGDLGKMDINGFFYLIDRKDDRIVKGGFSIFPTEIESVLMCHPDVADAAVVGVPEDLLGEEVKGCVVLKEGAKVTTDQLAEYCRENMAIYKIPTIIRFYKDLPRTSTGRINRKDLQI